MSTAPVAARPGTTYFAPQARIRRLSSTLQAAPEAGEELPVLAADVLHISVTRVHSGTSQYSLTLNNWFDDLPQRRPAGNGQRSRVEPQENGRPVWPRFKYNTLQSLRFGDRLRIDMRYCGELPGSLDRAALGAHAWVPMIAGPVTDMRFTFAEAEGSRVTISGEDDLSRLKDKSQGKAEFSRLSERSIVERVLHRCSYPLPMAAPLLEWPPFAVDDSRGLSETLQGGQSALDFLNKLADRLDFEVFVEFDRFDIESDPAAVTFHFEPARSLVHPDSMPGNTFLLQRERQLIDFTPTIKVIDQYSEIVVKGRHRDRNRPERVEQLAGSDAVQPELHTAAGDPPLLSGPAIRAEFFPNRPNRAEIPNQSNVDSERAQRLADALIRRKARELLTIEATTIGLPRLRPGQHVEIRGFRAPFDGFYYVTKTIHTYGADGFRTRIFARRPGMPAPASRET